METNRDIEKILKMASLWENKKHAVPAYKFVVAMAISTIISVWSSGCGRNKDTSPIEVPQDFDIPKIEQNQWQYTHPTELLFNFLWGTSTDVDTRQKISLDKDTLEQLYDLYASETLTPSVKRYMRGVIFNAYIDMIQGGYTLNGYQDLDTLKDIIRTLSNWIITIQSKDSMPENPEFHQTITVRGRLQDNILYLEQLWRFPRRSSSVGNTYIHVNIDKLLTAHVRDTPQSLLYAEQLVTHTNNAYIEAFRDLTSARGKIWRLESQIERLWEEIDSLRQSHRDSIEQIESERDAKIQEIRQRYEAEEQRLQNIHDQEVSSLQADIQARDAEIQDIRQRHQREINELRSQHAIEKRNIWDKHNQDIIQMDERRSQEISELEQKIQDMEEESDRLKELHTIRIRELNTRNTRLQDEVRSLSSENTDLNATIHRLRSNIEGLETEKNALSRRVQDIEAELDGVYRERNELTQQINAVWDARGTLLSRAQQDIRESNMLNIRLEDRISQLEARISELSQSAENMRYERGQLESDIRTYRDRISTFEAQQQELQDQVDTLQEHNDQLTTEKESLQSQRDSIRADADQEILSIKERLEDVIKENTDLSDELETTTREKAILRWDHEALEAHLARQVERNQALIRQLQELESAVSNLAAWSMELSEWSIGDALREARYEQQRLQSENEELAQERDEAIREKEELERKLNQVRVQSIQELEQQRREFSELLVDYMLSR